MGDRDDDSADLTGIFDEIRGGDDKAESRLFHAVYAELRRMAHGKVVRESPANTLQTTALVNEAYLRLCKGATVSWENRRHFFGAAANAMRQILIDRAVKRKAEIHGGKLKRVPLGEEVPDSDRPLDILALDEALVRLGSERPRHAKVVLHRYFLGLTVKETAEILGIAPRTVDGDWRFAKAWLRREMTQSTGGASEGRTDGV